MFTGIGAESSIPADSLNINLDMVLLFFHNQVVQLGKFCFDTNIVCVESWPHIALYR